MKASPSGSYATSLLLVLFFLAQLALAEQMGTASGYGYGYGANYKLCLKGSTCGKRLIRCPAECPHFRPWHPHRKYCHINCDSPKCEAVCKPPGACEKKGSICKDPRFIGGDGVVFYFHGRKGEHFTLISDPRFQINARFIGLRPQGRTRDFTWVQALGFMFGSHSFTVEAAQAERWDDAEDHLRFSCDGEPVELPEGHRSSWSTPDGELTVERTGRTNNVTVKLREGLVVASVNAVPVTEEDDRIHKYQIPSGDCFAHLDVQFSFDGLSPEVEGVLGRTYQPDYVSPAKTGVAMPVLGGADKYWTPSLVAPRCNACVFTPAGGAAGASLIRQVAAEN